MQIGFKGISKQVRKNESRSVLTLSSPYRVLCKAVGMVLVDTPHLLPAVKMEPWVLSPPHHHHHKANRESDDDCCYDDGGDDDLHFGGGVVCLPLCWRK